MTKSVCVFCGARNGRQAAHATAAAAVGSMLAQEGWRLVYGAGDVGLMGECARAAQVAGGATFGVIPRHLVHSERGKADLTHLVVTETMHERKKIMFMNSDAILVMPGGAGTLDELLEILTWRQLGLHEKPVFLLNTEAYWTPLLQLLDHVIGEGFAPPDLRNFLTVLPDVPALRVALRGALA